jgi:hypothetical protein
MSRTVWAIAALSFAAGALVLLATAPMVRSAEMPDFNVEAYCKMEATRGSSFNAAFADLCEKSIEPRFVKRLSYKWAYVPDKIQNACISRSGGSYEKLNDCVDDALNTYPSTLLPQIWTLEWRAEPLGRFWTADECTAQRQQKVGICRLGYK